MIKPEQLRDWIEIDFDIQSGVEVSKLEQFIHDNEEATTQKKVDEWRQSLCDVINEQIEEND